MKSGSEEPDFNNLRTIRFSSFQFLTADVINGLFWQAIFSRHVAQKLCRHCLV